MVTVRTGKAAAALGLLLLVACSREQQDWRSAEAADSTEAYDQFVQRHPESELAVQARARLAQLQEDRDWQAAGKSDSAEAYRHFITEHPTGRWAQEARIRMENFALGAQTGVPDAAQFATPRSSTATIAAVTLPAEAAKAVGSWDSSTAQNSRRVWTSRPPEVPAPVEQQLDKAEVQIVPAPERRADRTAQLSDAATAELGTSVASGTNAMVPAEVPSAAPAEQAAMAFAVPTSSGSGSVDVFGIQLGSFSTPAAASSAWSFASTRFAPELQGLLPRVVAADTAAGRVFRLQMSVGDEDRARSLCSVLRARGQSCLPVPPH